MPAATTMAIIGVGTTLLATGATAYTAKRARDNASKAKESSKNQMMRAERERALASERAEADASRDMASLRRRMLGSFGRGTNLMKTAPEQEGVFGKTLIGS